MHHIARCCQPIPGMKLSASLLRGGDFRAPGRLRTAGGAALPCAGADRRGGMGRKLLGGIFAGGARPANDRSGLLRDITTILANEKVNVLGVASRSDIKQQIATIDMTIEIYNLQVLGRVLGKLNQCRM